MATRVVSDVQKINSAIADVYAFLSDFSKIGKLIETARQMGAGNQMPELADKRTFAPRKIPALLW